MQTQTPALESLYEDSCRPELDFEKRFRKGTEIIEYITFSEPSELKSFLNKIFERSEEEFYYMPFYIKALIFRLFILQTPEDTEVIEWAANNLLWFVPAGPGSEEYVESLRKKLKGI